MSCNDSRHIRAWNRSLCVAALLLCVSAPNALSAAKDPVSALGEDDMERLSGPLNDKVIKEFLAGYVDRAEKVYCEQHEVPLEFVAWLAERSHIREAFWLALSPGHDNIAEAVKIFDALRTKHPKKTEKYYHLAIAVAVVWDTPDAVKKSRRFGVWGIEDEQFKPIPTGEKVFEYFTDPRYVRFSVYKPGNLPWPVLVHLVDFDITREEYEWALTNYKGKRSVLQKTYSDVEYDYQKLKTKRPALGRRHYTLPNILAHGGICGDQAHFATRIAKSFGVPAMKVAGKGRYGGAGHVWAGYLVTKSGKPRLEFTGRYFLDFYYTGNVLDPQTKTLDLDRSIAMMYEGASASYGKYIDSLALSRAARKIKADEPELSLKLTEQAVRTNYFCKPAWELLMEHITDGTLDRKKGLSWFNVMMDKLKKHPDMTMKCLSIFMGCIPKDDTKNRQNLYNQAFMLYKKRPDLQINLRIAQCRELSEADMAPRALSLGFKTCRANALEAGSLILPLVEQCIAIAKKKNLAKRAKPELKKIATRFPKERGDEVSPAYIELKKLMNSLE